MRHQVPRLNQRSSYAEPTPAPDHVESALEALRREWRSGCKGTMVRLAAASVRRLHASAISHEAAVRLAAVETRLRDYTQLPPERRQAELTEIANELKAIRPLLRAAATPSSPVGKLHSAVAPGRAPAAPKTPRRSSAPAVRPANPSEPVTVLPRVGSAVAKKLAKLKIQTVEDLLRFAPRHHVDYSRTVKIGAILGFGQHDDVTVRGEVVDLKFFQGPPPRVQIRLADETGWVKVTWFNSYIAKQISVGDEIAISGRVESGFGPLSFTNPEWEKVGGPALSTGRMTPIYRTTEGLAQKTLRSLTRAALDATKTTVREYLPPAVMGQLEVPPLREAYEQLHYPDSTSKLEQAQRRFALEELFLLQLEYVRRKRERQATGGIPIPTDSELYERFRRSLPFQLTGAQERALSEILADLARPQPMTRLLQGDVGSGKTVVAAAAALMTVAAGYQVGVLAPTEILAEQHFHNFRGLYAGLEQRDRPVVALLTGSTRASERRTIIAGLETGVINVLVGTHAIIQEDVPLPRIGLAIVDEQHRFGVRQRGELSAKATGLPPHVLSMTATPIPRTLNMVLNGDLDVSIIDALPPGRIPIETHRYYGEDRRIAYDLVRTELAKGHQVFVICPLVEESETLEAKAAVAEAERLQRDVFPDARVAVLHGRMSGREKDRIMTAFRDHEADILVSTSVIEVGIDVPNATVIMIEGADRFGLAQLHQFRGRVGRGGKKSYCLLLADSATPEAEARLDMMVQTNDGFVLAEKDLELRGPGDFIGTRQSGMPAMSWLDGSFDSRLLDLARRVAESVLSRDPKLELPEHQALRARLEAFWASVAPDVPAS